MTRPWARPELKRHLVCRAPHPRSKHRRRGVAILRLAEGLAKPVSSRVRCNVLKYGSYLTVLCAELRFGSMVANDINRRIDSRGKPKPRLFWSGPESNMQTQWAYERYSELAGSHADLTVLCIRTRAAIGLWSAEGLIGREWLACTGTPFTACAAVSVHSNASAADVYGSSISCVPAIDFDKIHGPFSETRPVRRGEWLAG